MSNSMHITVLEEDIHMNNNVYNQGCDVSCSKSQYNTFAKRHICFLEKFYPCVKFLEVYP